MLKLPSSLTQLRGALALFMGVITGFSAFLLAWLSPDREGPLTSWPYVVAIVFFSIIGTVAYLLFSRRSDSGN